MPPASIARSLRRPALLASALTVGCLSRWAGCSRYDVGTLSGPGWTARVECAPHTEVHLSNAAPGAPPVLGGCTARWRLQIERAGERSVAELQGPRHASRDCGDVRRACSSARAELAQRAVTLGTWVAASAPGGRTRIAFVPSLCGRASVLAEDPSLTLAPAAAVAARPDGPAYIDAVIAREPITGSGWSAVCGATLTQRVAAVRAAMLQCRVPDTVASELFAVDSASVQAAWDALVAESLPCSFSLRRVMRQRAAVLAALALGTLAACETRCSPRGRIVALNEAGQARLPGAHGAARRIAERGPPPRPPAGATPAEWRRSHDGYEEWLVAQWTLTRLDATGGTELGLATLRRLPAAEGRLLPRPVTFDDAPSAADDDPFAGLCVVFLQGDQARGRAGLWQIANDEGLGVATRQYALMMLGHLGDPRADGATLAHNPLTQEQRALVTGAIRGAPTGASGSGHHRHHHH